MILAGDIGGTNTRLAFFDDDAQPHHVREYPSQRYNTEDGLARIVGEYLDSFSDKKPAFARACFGVAGPVKQAREGATAKVTNLAWTVDQRRLAPVLKLDASKVAVINDLAANAEGIGAVGRDQLVTLHKGEEREGNRAIISAGTGLGVAGLHWDEGPRVHHAVPSEGGHASFGPRTALERDLCAYLAAKEPETFAGHVSWERVLSGPGIYNLFDYLRHAGIGEQTVVIPDGASPGEAAKLVSKAAADGGCDRASRAMDLFVSLYGAAAGNLALTFVALGGVYVGGGIAPKIIDKLKGPAFMEAFLSKGPLRKLLERVPVHVILDEHTALRGAARYAARAL